jgi:transposase-like protein
MSDEREDENADRCTARTRTGARCKARRLDGTDRCHHHTFRVPGRPSKLDPGLTERIIDAVLDGNYLETAAQIVGVSPSTLYRWLRRADEAEAHAQEHGEEDPRTGAVDLYANVDPAEWPYLDFRHALKSAEAYAEAELLRFTRTAAPGWQAYMTILERRHPSRWGRRDTSKVEHSGGVRTSVEVIVPSDEDRAGVLSRLAESGALDVLDAEAKGDRPPS